MFISLSSTIKIFLFTAVEVIDAGVNLLSAYLLKYSKSLAVKLKVLAIFSVLSNHISPFMIFTSSLDTKSPRPVEE